VDEQSDSAQAVFNTVNLLNYFMGDQKGGFKFNATLDIGHIITFLMMLGALAVAWRGVGENKVATDARITAVELKASQSLTSIEAITKTLSVIDQNQVRLAIRLDNQEKRFDEDHVRIRDLEKRQ
jgi:hypothetical protein